MVDVELRAAVRQISDRIVTAQQPIRVLDAVKWDDRIRDRFFQSDCREQPDVGPEYYATRPLDDDPASIRATFLDIEAAIGGQLGTTSPISQLLLRTCEQYRLTLDLLEARGTPEFGPLAVRLYGAPSDVFHVNGPSVADLSRQFRAASEWLGEEGLDEHEEQDITGAEAVVLLQERLDLSMGEGLVEVRLDDGIVADAAAGSNYIKIRADAKFSDRQLLTLEAHEGWTHVGTTRNGLDQSVCTFLGKAPPPVTVTQEGLATLVEILSMRSHAARLLQLANRIDAITMATEGATFVEIVEHFRTLGLSEDSTWQLVMRVFRGSTPTGPPFTKDLAYGRGLVLTYAYVRIAVRQGRLDRIPMLFCGKVDLSSLGTVNYLFDEGLVDFPRFLPAAFRDPHPLVAQIAFSRFLRDLDFERLESDYSPLL